VCLPTTQFPWCRLANSTNHPIDRVRVRPTHAVGTETASERDVCCELHGSLSLWRDHGIDDRVRCGHARSAIFGCVCHGGGSTNHHGSPTHNAVTSIVSNSTTNQKGARACAHTHHHDSQASLLSKENSSARREAPHAHGHLTSTLRAVGGCGGQLSQTQHSFSDSLLKRPIPASY